MNVYDNNGCDLLEEIGDSGIVYCKIPISDQSDACKDCKGYKTDALNALVKEIDSLAIRIGKLE